MEPDIEVDQRDDLVVKGRDPQLEKGMEVVTGMLETVPHTMPKRPAPPVRN